MNKRFHVYWSSFLRFLSRLHPAKLVLSGYASYILIGWLILCLPLAHKTSGLRPLDHLFTATSAVSTTGLVTLSVSDNYTFAGQLVILLLIQLGGIGYMTFGSFILLACKRDLSPLQTRIGQTVFTLPENFGYARFIKGVIAFTAAIEALGAVLLYPVLRGAGVADPGWSAVFHSISAFCTAGFSLYNNSFEDFTGNLPLNLIIAALSYLGAIGFIVCLDFWNKLRGRTHGLTLTSKIILLMTAALSVAGTLLLFFGEPALGALPLKERALGAFFQTMTAMTTVGFDTVNIGTLSKATLLVIIVLMVIGSSPSGTGGGLKSTTFSAFLGIMRSALRGETEVHFWGKLVPLERLWTAVGSAGFYVAALLTGTYLLEQTEKFTFEQNFFEAASALGTVGLSTGITGSLSDAGKLLIILLMFCGRLGPLTMGLALFHRQPDAVKREEEDLAV